MPPKKQQKSRKKKEPEDILMEDSPGDSRLDVFSSTTFQARRRKLYEEARASAKDFVVAHVQLLEQARAQILDMKQEETDASGYLAEYMRQESHQNDAYRDWNKNSGALVVKLGQQRSSAINETSSILNMARTERNNALRQFSKEARIQVEKSREEEKLATDASSLIRHYKSLLVGTYDNKGRERKRG